MSKFNFMALKTFYVLAQEGSYPKASTILGIHPPAMAHHVSSLEKELGVKLFKRFYRGMTLTEEGKKFIPYVKGALAKIDEGVAAVKETPKEKETIKILTTTGVTNLWLIEKISQLHSLFPHLKIRIISTNEAPSFLESDCDFALLPKVKPHPNIVTKKVRTVHISLFASHEYLHKNGTPKTEKDLDQHNLIGFYNGASGHRGNVDWHLHAGLPQGSFREPFLIIDSAIGQFEAACKGLGIIAISEEFPYLNKSNLIKVDIGKNPEEVAVFFVYNTRDEHLPLKDVFEKILKED